MLFYFASIHWDSCQKYNPSEKNRVKAKRRYQLCPVPRESGYALWFTAPNLSLLASQKRGTKHWHRPCNTTCLLLYRRKGANQPQVSLRITQLSSIDCSGSLHRIPFSLQVKIGFCNERRSPAFEMKKWHKTQTPSPATTPVSCYIQGKEPANPSVIRHRPQDYIYILHMHATEGKKNMMEV